MKPKDALLDRWEAILAQKDDAPAICDTGGKVSRTFREVDNAAREFESKMDSFHTGNVLAVQIGNHTDWPSIFTACLRRGVVVLPLEQSISDQQRDAALKICNASGVFTVTKGGSCSGRCPQRRSRSYAAEGSRLYS